MAKWLYAAWVVAEILLVVASVAMWLAAPEHTTLNLALSAFTSLLGFLLLYPRRVDFLTWIGTRQFRALGAQLASFGFLLAVVGLLNHLAWKFAWRHDFTAQGLNTLSAQTRQIISSSEDPASMVFFARREDWPRGLALLKLFREARPGLTVEAVDIEAAPRRAKAAGVRENGTVVLTLGEKRTSFSLKDELGVANAWLRLLRTRTPKVFFTVGHGEPICSSEAVEGISGFCTHLRQQLYEVATLDLQAVKDVPADAALVVVWGPTSGLRDEEIQRLQRWLEKGGSLLALLPPAFGPDPVEPLRALLRRWGLSANNDLVVDRLSTLESQEATIPIVKDYGDHPVTRGFTARTFFPLSGSVETVEPLYQGVATHVLAYTSAFPGAWAERDLKGLEAGSASFGPGDLKGPVPLMAVAERVGGAPGERDTRVGVVGNDVLGRNAWQNQPANANLLLNLVSWLAHDEGLVSLNRPQLNQGPVVLSAAHLHVVFFLTVVTLPLLGFGAALWVYRRRRRL